MNKSILRNINYLRGLKREKIEGATQATVKRIDEIIKLYSERKISNRTTAENLIKGLTSSNKKVYDKTFQKYKDSIKELKEKQPLNQRMAEAKKRKKKNTYLVSFYLYKRGSPEERKQKVAFRANGFTYFLVDFDLHSATIKASEFPNREAINKRILKHLSREDYVNEIINPEYTTIINLLKEDEEFKQWLQVFESYGYPNPVDAIKITDVELMSEDGEKYNIVTENLRDAVNVSIYHRYVHTPIAQNADTLKEAISKGHYIDNECWINLLTDYYADTIMNERTRKRLTREKVIEIIGRDDFSQKGASIQEMQKVFEEYNLQVRVYNFFSHLVYKYDPPKRNHHIKTLYTMVKNNHIYALNYDLKSVQQNQSSTSLVCKATTDYYLNEKEAPPKYRMIKDIDDILKLKLDKDELEVYLVPELNNLHELFFKVIGSGYEPKITFQAGIITEMRLKLKKVKYIIKTQNLVKSSGDGCIAVRDEVTYNRMNEAMFKFNKSLFNPIHKSHYNDIDIAILDEARTIAPLGLFYPKAYMKTKESDMIEIDLCKAFTKAFMDISKIVVFNQFDVWRACDNSFNIDNHHELTMYYIRVSDLTTSVFFNPTRILFSKQYNLITGQILKKLPERVMKKIDILYFKEPSFIHKVDYKGIVDELWNTTIDENDADEDKYIKKLIGNVNYGLLEKGGSTSYKSIVYKNLREAVSNQTDYGGRVHKLSCVKETVEVERDEAKFSTTINSYEDELKSYYILNLKDEAHLKNGFRWIKEILLQYHNFTMWESWWKLRNAKVSVYSVKTDAYTIRSEDEAKAREALDFHNDVGGWRVSKTDDIKLPTDEYKFVENKLIEIPTYESEEIEVKDEYDTDAIVEKIIEKKQVMIRGTVPGTGKSYICKRMAELGYKVVFVCPTNRLLQEFEGEAMTVNKFFGISFGDAYVEPFDYSDYDVIVFDEIYFSGLSVYWKIKRFVEQNKDSKIIVATGDCKQLKSVQPITNTKDYEPYVDSIIDNIFEHHILLKECKRLHTDEDKDKLHNIKHDIFVNKISVDGLVKKYGFRYTDDITSSPFNIAFLNNTCKNVSSKIREMENRTEEFELGERLICREYTVNDKHVFNVNFQYDIVLILDEGLLLKNVKDGKLHPLPLDKARSSFIFASCSTAHSAQGCSVDSEITIFDYNHFLVKNYPEWLFTALTRCRDLSKVKFFKYSKDTSDDFNQKLIMSYYNRKIENYRLQDRKGKRLIPKEGYVNTEWFLKNITNSCNYCGCGFTIDINRGGIMSNLTAQRVNNEEAHTLDNIVPYCRRCNCSCK